MDLRLSLTDYIHREKNPAHGKITHKEKDPKRDKKTTKPQNKPQPDPFVFTA